MTGSNTYDHSSTIFPNGHIFTILFAGAVGTLSIVSLIILVSYMCSQKMQPPQQNDNASDDDDSVHVDMGIDEVTLNSYPKMLFVDAKEKGIDIPSCCPVCLQEYAENDVVRQLPRCGHFFHVLCLDPWLKNHRTCPLCRDSSDVSLQISKLPTFQIS